MIFLAGMILVVIMLIIVAIILNKYGTNKFTKAFLFEIIIGTLIYFGMIFLGITIFTIATLILLFTIAITLAIIIHKYCQEKLKKVFVVFECATLVTIILITLYCAILFIDMSRVMLLEEPVFAELTDNNIYKGLGYTVEIKNDKVFGKSIIMYMFGTVIYRGGGIIYN